MRNPNPNSRYCTHARTLRLMRSILADKPRVTKWSVNFDQQLAAPTDFGAGTNDGMQQPQPQQEAPMLMD